MASWIKACSRSGSRGPLAGAEPPSWAPSTGSMSHSDEPIAAKSVTPEARASGTAWRSNSRKAP